MTGWVVGVDATDEALLSPSAHSCSIRGLGGGRHTASIRGVSTKASLPTATLTASPVVVSATRASAAVVSSTILV